MKQILLFSCGILLSISLLAQNTVGTIIYDPTLSQDGYNLFYPHNQSKVFLTDNCGKQVHTWDPGSSTRPGNSAYIMNNGDVILAHRPAAIAENPIWAGGGGATIERRTWNNEVLWSYTKNDEEGRLHHDFAVIPNGNVLAIQWEAIDSLTAVQNGRNPELIEEGWLWPDKIIELQDNGEGGADVVWEWKIMDHLIQDFDENADNYGVPGDHPELIDFNFGSNEGHPDWNHANAIDYNLYTDQILLSIPTFDEIWIIDHSTTSEQASSHSGGLSGIGGDLMWRWGNPAAYDRGDSEDQKLFYSHNCHWSFFGLSPDHPDFGKIAVFSNRNSDTVSIAHLLNPTFDDYDWFYPLEDNVFTPSDFDWSYGPTGDDNIHSDILSSVQRLENGNTLIGIGRSGRAIEITPEEEIVWEYVTPLQGGEPVAQLTELPLSANLTFRMERYPVDFAGFNEIDLVPGEPLELDPIYLAACAPISVEEHRAADFELYPNPANQQVLIRFEESGQNTLIEVYNFIGEQVHSVRANGKLIQLDVSHLASGSYLVRVNHEFSQKLLIH